MNAEDREGIRRVEQLLRQHADHEDRWRKQLKDELDELREEMRAQAARQEEWNNKFDNRQRDLERKMAIRAGMAQAAKYILATVIAVVAALGAWIKFKV
jgi:rubrerythrin